MSAQANHWKLGLFVVGAVVLMVSTLLWVGSQRLSRETQRFHCFFDESVQGLELGAPAKMRGVTIGTVASIGFASDRRHVDVEVDFYLDILERLGFWPLPGGGGDWRHDLRVQLGTTGITGTKYLEIDFVDGDKVPIQDLPFPTPTTSLPTMPSTLKSIEHGLTALTDALPRIVETIESLGDRLLETVDDMRMSELSEKSLRVLDDAEVLLSGIDIDHLEGRVVGLLDEAGATLRTSRGILEGIEGRKGAVAEALESWTTLADTASQTLESLDLPVLSKALREATTSYQGLAVEATSLTLDMHGDLSALHDALRAMQALVEYLERNPSSLLRGRQTPDQGR